MFDNIFNEERFEEAVKVLASIEMSKHDEEIKKKSAEFMQECMVLEASLRDEFKATLSEILKNA